MMINDKMLKSSFTEEQEMIEKVLSFLENREDHYLPIERDFLYIIDDRQRVRFDLFLPEGCPSLGYYGQTAFELKNRLGADTIYHYYEYYNNVLTRVGIRNFILLYNDKNNFSTSLLKKYSKYKSDGFHVLSVHVFCKSETKERRSQPWREDHPHQELSYTEKKQRLIEDAHTAFVNGHDSLFLGAGVSCSVYVPKWCDFLSELLDCNQGLIRGADYSCVNESCDHSSIITGRYIENRFPTKTEFEKDRFKKEMYGVLYKNSPIPNSDLFNELVEVICYPKRDGGYCVDQAISFNYDDLLETALKGKRFSHSIFDRTIYTGNGFPIYHVHGMIPQKRMIDSTPVLGEQEYHQLYKEAYHWSNVIQLYALSRSTCFFIGLSMIDPNLRRLLDISRNGVGLNNKNIESMEPKHFAIMERKHLDTINPDSSKDDEHIKNIETMMYQLGINIIWYDNTDGQHLEVPKILKAIRLGPSTIV